MKNYTKVEMKIQWSLRHPVAADKSSEFMGFLYASIFPFALIDALVEFELNLSWNGCTFERVFFTDAEISVIFNRVVKGC